MRGRGERNSCEIAAQMNELTFGHELSRRLMNWLRHEKHLRCMEVGNCVARVFEKPKIFLEMFFCLPLPVFGQARSAGRALGKNRQYIKNEILASLG